MSSISYSKVVADIYDASLDPSAWNKCAKSIAEFVDGDTSNLFFLHHKNAAKNMFASSGIDKDIFHNLYTKHYINIDPWNEPLLKHPSGKVANHVDMGVDMNEFIKTEYYNDFWSKAGLHHLCGFRLNIDGVICAFGVHRKKSGAPFSKDELLQLELLTPHIKHSLTLYNDYISTKNCNEIAPELFLAANVGFIALDHKKNIINTNEIAENVLLREDGLIKMASKLNAKNTKENNLLQERLSSILLLDKPSSHENLLFISRNNNISSYALSITPAVSKTNVLPTEVENAAFYIFIIDPDHSSSTSIEIFSKYYGLTKAEANVVNHLLEGSSIPEIADKLSISKETIRTHVKSCFLKTHTCSQSQLVNKAIKESFSI